MDQDKNREVLMNLSAASRAALLPWLFLVAVGFGIDTWDGQIESFGWPEYLGRLIPGICFLYLVLIAAVLWNRRRTTSHKPSLGARRIQLFIGLPAWLVALAAMASERLDVAVPSWIATDALLTFAAASLASFLLDGLENS